MVEKLVVSSVADWVGLLVDVMVEWKDVMWVDVMAALLVVAKVASLDDW